MKKILSILISLCLLASIAAVSYAETGPGNAPSGNMPGSPPDGTPPDAPPDGFGGGPDGTPPGDPPDGNSGPGSTPPGGFGGPGSSADIEYTGTVEITSADSQSGLLPIKRM